MAEPIFNIPGVSDWIAPRRNALLGFASGLAGGRNLSQGLGMGFQNAAAGRQQDDAYATAEAEKAERTAQLNQTVQFLQEKHPDLAQMVQSGMPVAEAWGTALKRMEPQGGGDAPASVQEYQFYADQAAASGQEPMPYEEWRKGGNQTVRAGMGQPIPVRNAVTGEAAAAMPMSDGTYMNPFTQQPFGEEWQFDPAWVAAQRAQGRAVGEQVGGAQFDLPKAALVVDQTVEAINAVRAEQRGMDEHFGMGGFQQLTPAWPGSEKAKFQVAAERAINRAFLEGREMLKGGGQITDFESRKAEAAITEAQLAMEKGDKAQFLRALDTFEQAVTDGLAKMQAQAGTMPSIGGGGSAPAVPAAPAGQTSTGVQWSVEP